jgi:hypothetical protein
VLYTEHGGTAQNCRALAARLTGLLVEAGLPAQALILDDTDADPTDEQLACRLLFKKVAVPHSDIPITYLGRLLQASGLP